MRFVDTIKQDFVGGCLQAERVDFLIDFQWKGFHFWFFNIFFILIIVFKRYEFDALIERFQCSLIHWTQIVYISYITLIHFPVTRSKIAM